MEQNAKILLVDDDAEIREVIRILLESEGCEIVEADSGARAVEIMDNTIDLIIMDVMMPGMSGIDASQVDEKAFDRIEAMIYSMTKEEREKPSIINPKRKRRIAAGSGTRVEDVNKLLKQFEMMQKMMKQFKKSPKGFARKLGGLMGNPGAFRGMK